MAPKHFFKYSEHSMMRGHWCSELLQKLLMSSSVVNLNMLFGSLLPFAHLIFLFSTFITLLNTTFFFRKRTGMAWNDFEFDNFFGPVIIKGIGSENLIYEGLQSRILNRIIEYNENIFVSSIFIFHLFIFQHLCFHANVLTLSVAFHWSLRTFWVNGIHSLTVKGGLITSTLSQRRQLGVLTVLLKKKHNKIWW